MRFSLLILLVVFFIPAAAIEPSRVETAMSALDQALYQREIFIASRRGRIDSLVSITEHRGADPRILMQIADAYTGFNNDSAMAYLRRGELAGSGKDSYPFIWKRAALMPLAGFFENSQRLLSSIPYDSIPPEQLPSYCEAARQLHSYLASFFSNYPGISDGAEKQSLAWQRRLLDVLPPESPEYRYNMGEYSYRNGNVAMGEVILQEVLDTLDVSSPYRARTAHHLASIARGRNDLDSYRYYLALAAESDLRSATLETVALQELGDLAFAMGDSERAHKYLATALLNARECATPMRAVSAANSLPIAEQANRQKSDRWQRSFNWMVAILVTVVIILVLALLVLRHEIHNMKEMEHKLRHANNAKEIYIGQFLQLCSIYMDKLNRFSGIAARKLAAGQADELHALLKSGKFVEEHSNEFFRVFDNAFLNIYPDFINEVNRLMRPECRIEPRNGELLNTDLRILAFMRLGIDESARIAQILNYSVNTIYAYRNRLRSRAIDKDGFEKAIMGIAR